MNYLVVGLFDIKDTQQLYATASGAIAASPSSMSYVACGSIACGSISSHTIIRNASSNIIREVSGIKVVSLGRFSHICILGIVCCKDEVVSEAIFDPDDGDLFFRCEARFLYDTGLITVPFLFGNGKILIDSSNRVCVGLGDSVLKKIVFDDEVIGILNIAVEARKEQIINGPETVSHPKYFICS
jgi:hypothetical protein